MLISFSWLKQFISHSDSLKPEDVAEKLKLATVEVEEIKKLGEGLEKIDDFIFEIDNKSLSHRPDLWGHYGMAREVAVLFDKRLKDYKIKRFKSGNGVDLQVKVEDKKLCPRYMAIAVNGVKVAPSPQWLQSRLMSVGVRPINNIVDITNYVMLDLGQPMHSFDAERLQRTKIIVRRAKNGEKFVTLDGQEQKLTNEMLVIADEKKVIALAGVMGGENSEISKKTETIIFESANFDATNIRRTSLKLGLRTESSARFEKSLDPNLCELALKRAVQLVLEMCPEARVAGAAADVKHFRLNQGPIKLSLEFLNKKIGVDIKKSQAIGYFKKLGFSVKEKKKDVLSVIAPTWRATKDISIQEDLVEEVARLYGYDHLPATMPVCSIVPPEINRLRQLERKVMETLVQELSYTEVYNYSFVSPGQVEKLGNDLSKYLELDNPLSKEKPFLRRCLLLNLLENLEKNLAWFDEVKLAESGQVFRPKEKGEKVKEGERDCLPGQETWLTTVWASKKEMTPFWQARRAAEMIFAELNLEWQARPMKEPMPWQHPSRQAALVCEGKEVGLYCELNPLVGEKFGLLARVGVLEINLNRLLEVGEKAPVAGGAPDYPEVKRDIAFLVDKKVSHENLVSVIRSVDVLIKKTELFDVYEGEKIGAGKKSVAYHLIFRHPERTLTSVEVEAAREKVKKILRDKFSAEIRE